MLGVSKLGRLLTTPWEWRYNQVELCPCLSLLLLGCAAQTCQLRLPTETGSIT